ncbi:ABC transporter substrate-binding protein [Ensifer adhaerens]|uniref:ABC transporter substrate-binding protein n=1 Tax=Ensifer adhaerens TaxID=106592 RepID=UPI003D07AC00
MSSLTRRAFSLAIVIAAVAGASFARAEDGPRTIEHQLGTTELGGKPQKIVALEFSFVQSLDALGVVPVGIADDNQAKRIEQLLGKTIDYASVGTRLEPNLELISNLAPDLIIADEIRHSAIYQQLGSIAPTIVLNSWEGDYETIKASVVTIADALGDKARGEQALAEHEARIAALVARIPKGEERRILLAVATPDSMSLHTSASFTGSVFKAMGLTPAIGSSDAVESGAGLERLVSVAPDILLVATDPGGSVLDQWRDNAVWNAVPAVRNKMVFEVDRNQFARFRGLKTAEMIAGEILAKVYDAK